MVEEKQEGAYPPRQDRVKGRRTTDHVLLIDTIIHEIVHKHKNVYLLLL